MGTLTWLGSGIGDWWSGQNWSSGVAPGSADSVLVGGTTAGLLLLPDDLNVDIAALTVTDRAATIGLDGATLSINGAATLAGGVDGPGTLAVHGTGLLGTAGLTLGGGAVWDILGTVSVLGSLGFGDVSGPSGTIAVGAGAALLLTDDAAGMVLNGYTAGGSFVLGSGLVVNAGTLEKTGGSGVSDIQAAVVSSGALIALSGTIELDSGGTLSGVVGGIGGGMVNLAGGSFALGASTLTVTGAIELTGAGITLAAGQVLALAGTASFGEAGLGGFLNGPGTLANRGSATILAEPTTQLTMGGGLTWSNSGVLQVGGPVAIGDLVGNAASIANLAGGTIALVSDAAGIFINGWWDANDVWQVGTGSLSNAGLLEKTAGSGTSQIFVPVSNSGTILATSGTLELDGGGTLGGAIGGSGGGMVALAAGSYGLGAASVGLAGAMALTGATIALSGGTLALSGAPLLAGGRVTGPGTLVTTGATLSALSLATGAVWSSLGNAVASGAVTGAGTVQVAAGGSLQLAADAAALDSAAASIAGWLGKTGGTGTSAVQANLALTGTLAVQTGAVALSGGGTLGGSIVGPGTLVLARGDYAVTGMVAAPLALSGGTIQLGANQDLAMADTLLLGSGAVDGAGILDGVGSATLSGPVSLGGGALWREDGSAVVSGTLSLGDAFGRSGAVLVAAGGSLTLTAGGVIEAGSISGQFGSGSVGVLGRLDKDASAGSALIAVPVVSSGSIAVAGGTLRLGGGGTLAVAVAGAGTLSLAGGNLTLAAGLALSVADLSLDGALVALAGALADGGTLLLNAGTLDLAGQALSQSGPALFDGGTLAGPGSLVTEGSVSLAPGPALTLGGGALWVDQGDASAAGWVTASGGTIEVAAAGTLLLTGDAAGVASGGSLLVSGLLEKSGGSGSSTVAAMLGGAGSIAVLSGTLALAGGGSFNGTVSGAGTLAFTGGATTLGPGLVDDAALLLAGGTLAGPAAGVTVLGTIALAAGTLVASPGGTLQIAALSSVQGTLSGGGTLLTTTATLAAGDTLTVGGALWRNVGTAALAGDVVFGATLGAGTLENDALLALAGGAVLSLGEIYTGGTWAIGAGVLDNLGTLQSQGLVVIGVPVAGGGAWLPLNGTLDLAGGGTLSGTLGGGAGTLLLSNGTFGVIGSLVALAGTALLGGGVVMLGAGQTLVLGSSDQLSGTEVDGAGTLLTSGSATLTTLTLGGGAVWSNSGTVLLAGTLSLGDGLGGSATVQNAASGLLFLAAGALATPSLGEAGGNLDNQGVVAGPSGGTAMVLTGVVNTGVLASTGGTLEVLGGLVSSGVILLEGGLIEVPGSATLSGIVEGTGGTLAAGTLGIAGVLEVAGTLDLAGLVAGTGTLEIAAGADIEIAGSLAVPVTFLGNGAVLQIDQPSLGLPDLQLIAASDTLVLKGATLTGHGFVPGSMWLTTAAGAQFMSVLGDPGIQVSTDALGDAVISFLPGPASPLASDDFLDSGNSDLLLQNANGTPQLWELSGLVPLQISQLPDPGPSWRIMGGADVYGDGSADLILENTTGTLAAWELGSNGQPWRGGAIAVLPAGTHFVAAGDVLDAGTAALVLQSDSGQISIWEMKGLAPTSKVALANPGPNWLVEAVGDLNGDGRADLILQNDATEDIAVWELFGAAILSATMLPNPGPGWQVRAVDDFNGDGHSDLVLQNTDGAAEILQMNGTSVIGTVALGNFGPYWHIVSAGAANGGANGELVWQNSQTGNVVTWEMLGTTPIAASMLVAGNTWSAIGMNPEDYVLGDQAPVVTATAGDDAFDYTQAGAGLWTIAGFDPVFDSIVLPAADFSNVQSLLNSLQNVPGGVMLPVTAGMTLNLPGVTASQLQAHDFALV